MLIWSGWGILVALFAMAGLVGGALLDQADPMLKGYGVPLGAVLAAALTFGLASWLGRDAGRVLVDPATGQQVVLRRRDSLFFIPVRIWTYIFLGMGAIMLTTQAMR